MLSTPAFVVGDDRRRAPVCRLEREHEPGRDGERAERGAKEQGRDVARAAHEDGAAHERLGVSQLVGHSGLVRRHVVVVVVDGGLQERVNVGDGLATDSGAVVDVKLAPPERGETLERRVKEPRALVRVRVRLWRERVERVLELERHEREQARL